jgi:hypothetical protein
LNAVKFFAENALIWHPPTISLMNISSLRVRLSVVRVLAISGGTGGDDAFLFLGTAAFSGSACELRYEYDGIAQPLLILMVMEFPISISK